MPSTVTVKIDRQGKITAEVNGIKGPMCELLLEKLGLGEVEHIEHKETYYDTDVENDLSIEEGNGTGDCAS